MPTPKIYYATEMAALHARAKPLDGTVEAAQAFVDGITRSKWWRDNCTPSWMGDKFDDSVPTRVQVVEERLGTGADTAVGRLYHWQGRRVPRITLSREKVNGDIPAVMDPWIICHELAHVWTVDENGWHGPKFCAAFYKLVDKWIGTDAADELEMQMKFFKVRLNYRLLSV